MAIWQFDFNIIPKQNMEKYIHREDIASWKDGNANIQHVNFLERSKSWSQDIVQYGEMDKTCIQYIYEDDILDEIFCRLDLRTLSRRELYKFIEYVNNINAVILFDGRFVLPVYDNLVNLIEKSNAYIFCNKPFEYLETMINRKKYRCPNCNNLTLYENPENTFELCEICGWEND